MHKARKNAHSKKRLHDGPASHSHQHVDVREWSLQSKGFSTRNQLQTGMIFIFGGGGLPFGCGGRLGALWRSTMQRPVARA